MELIFTLLLVAGGIECFFGYRIFRFLTAVIGFALGAVIGGALGMAAAGQVGAIAFGLIIGILGGFLAFTLYKVGVFIVCFGAGAVLGAVLGMLTGDQGTMVAFAGIAGLLLGVLGVILTKPIIIISTSVGGGMAAGSALGRLVQQPTMGTVLGVILVIVGILFQFMLDRKKPAPDREAGSAPEEKDGGIRPPRLKAAGAGGAAGEGLKGAFASLKSGAAGLGQKVGAGAQGVANSQMVRQLRGSIDNTKTVHPLSGWNELVRENSPLWIKGLPVAVNEARIVASPSEEGVRLALGFQNLSEQDILGVFFSVKCFDLLKQELEGIEKLAVQDFRLPSGGLWFSSQPFPLPDKDTRRVELTVKNVVFADGSIWSNETGAALAPTADQSALELAPELSQELFRACRAHVTGHDPEKIFRYQPREEADCWWCACGQLNTGGRCLACGMEQEALFELIRPERLSRLREERIAEQKRLEEERRQKIAEQTEAARQKAAEVSAKTAETLKKGLDKGAELSKQTGDVLNKGLSRGAELGKQTGDRAKAFWAEKIEPNKRTIAIAACVFVAVLAALLGAFFGLRAYRAGQEEKARLQAQQEAEERRQKAEEERRAAQELAEWEAQFFFPYSDKEAIDESDLAGMTEADLNLARFEILARRGRVFSTPEYARYFEGKPWYKPDSTFDENAAGALTDVERANIALFDAALAARRNARAARALLDKLGEYSGRLTVQGAAQVDGACFGLSSPGSYNDGRYQVSWSAGGTVSSTLFSGLLCAKLTDLDHNGTPELVTISLGYYEDPTVQFGSFLGDLCVEFWKYDGQSVVPFADKEYVYLAMPSDGGSFGELYYQPGSDRNLLHMSISSFDYGYDGQEDKYISLDGMTSLMYSSSEDGWWEGDGTDTTTIETWTVNGQEVGKGEYDQKRNSLPQGGTLWLDSGGCCDFLSKATEYGMAGSLCLNGPAEIAETEAELARLANN